MTGLDGGPLQRNEGWMDHGRETAGRSICGTKVDSEWENKKKLMMDKLDEAVRGQ